MKHSTSTIAGKLVNILTGNSGVAGNVSALADFSGVALQGIGPQQIVVQNIAPELSEQGRALQYPQMHVYCSKVSNVLREKFRTFSGEALMTIEARISQARMPGLETEVQLYVDAITQVLDSHRGDWGDGAFYAGGYEVNFGPVKQGGRNFLQIAKVTFTVQMSSN